MKKNKFFFSILLVLTNINLYANTDNEKKNSENIVCGVIENNNKSSGYIIYENDNNAITFNNIDEMKKNNAVLLHLGKCSKDL